MQVYLSEHIAPSAYARLARHFEIVDNFDHPEQLVAMIIRRAVVPRSVIAHAPNLKVIARAGVGLDNVDIKAATPAGVMVVNAPTSNIISAAELTIILEQDPQQIRSSQRVFDATRSLQR